MGVATESEKPSANILLNTLGNLKDIIKASNIPDVPKNLANNRSLIKPRILEAKVPILKI